MKKKAPATLGMIKPAYGGARLTATYATAVLIILAVCAGCGQPLGADKEATRTKWQRAALGARLSAAKEQFEYGQYDEAERIVRGCMNAGHQIPEAHLLLGKIMLAKGKLNQAAEQLTKAVELNGRLHQGWYWLGVAAQEDRDYVKAHEHYVKAVSLEPTNVDYILAVVDVQVAQSKYVEAIKLLTEKMEALPGDALLKITAADLMLRQGDTQSAIKLYEQAALLSNDSDIAETLGYCYMLDGSWNKAAGIFEQLAARHKGNSTSQKDGKISSQDEQKSKYLLQLLAISNMNAKRYDKAESYYSKLTAQQADNAEVWVKMGQAALGAGSASRAFMCAQKALALRSGYADAIALVGCAQYTSGHYTAAAESFERIVADRKNGAFSRLMRARCYEQLGQTGKAERAYKEILETNPQTELHDLVARGKDHNTLANGSVVTIAHEKSVAESAKTEALSSGKALSDTVANTDPRVEQSPSETDPPRINLPLLDNPGMADELIALNFEQVDIRIVLKTIGDITGINFVVDERVRGTVTFMSPTKIRVAEIYNVLESILEVQGCAAVPAGDLVKIVPRGEAAKRNLQVRVGSDPSQIPRNDSLVNQIITLKYADAIEVSEIIRPLLATEAHIATYPRTNSILITDTSSNIYHIAKIIERLDVPGAKEKATVIGLKYASAQVLSDQITRILQNDKASPSQIRGSRQVPGIQATTNILPDLRTNSIIVIANEQDTRTIKRLVEQLDVARPHGTTNVHVIYLKNAQAQEAAKSLTAALASLKITGAIESTQNVQVTADEGTNAIIITASAQDYEVIAEIVEKLDIVREQVLVEMLIMEVSKDALTEIGIDWATIDQAVDGSVRFFAATNFGPRVDFASGDLEGLAVGAWRGSGTNIRIGSILHALEKESGVNILSTPHILTSNHNKAKIIVGENRPFVMESRITETTDFLTPTVIKTYQYKDVGITLEITPHISHGGLIRLEIDSEFTKLIEDITSTSTDTPTTAKRQAQTVVSMNSGSTVVIGGLIRDDKVTVQKKIPLLGDIPLIGGLFRFQRDRLQKTNLLIFITPHVLASQEDLEHITEEKKKEMKPALGNLEKKNAKH